MNKYIMMTALAGVLMTSCQDDFDSVGNGSLDSNSIVFATTPAQAQTRAGVTISSIDEFEVSAFNVDKTSFFSQETFTYNQQLGVFKSQVTHYWPTAGTLDFYAISAPGSFALDANSRPTYSYSSWAAEEDLVAATSQNAVKSIPYPLTFKHLTSQIRVSAEAENKTEEMTYNLVSVKMTAPSSGTYSFASESGGIGSWTIDNAKTSEYSYEEALPRSMKQSGRIELSNCYWNILPVSTGKIVFDVEYQVLQNGKIIADFTGAQKKSCEVDKPNLQSGKMYNYNFILDLGTSDEITFTTDVTDWTDGENHHLSPDVPTESTKSLYYKIEGNVLYIRQHPASGYQERVMTSDLAQSKNGWWTASNKASITKAVIEEPIAPEACTRMFDGMNALTSIENLENLFLNFATDMSCMFQNCNALTSLGGCEKNWNTSFVQNMQYCFFKCRALKSLDLSNLNTDNVTNLRYMFYENTSLESVGNLVNWNIKKVTSLDRMFYSCVNLTSVGDISTWNAPLCTDATWMFGGESDNPMKLKSVDVSNLFVGSTALQSIKGMFNCCESLTSVGDLSNWEVENVTVFNQFMYNCYNLTSIGTLSSWHMPKCTTARLAFGSNKTNNQMSLASLDLGNLFAGTSSVTDICAMFQYTPSLTSVGDLSRWDVSKVTDASYLFLNSVKLKTVGDLSEWYMPKCTTAKCMFSGINENTMALETLDLSNLFKFPSVITDMSCMFTYCTNLTNVGSIGQWDVSNVTNMSSMFAAASFSGKGKFTNEALSGLANWNVGKVTDMTCMFYGQGTNLTELDLSRWNTSSCTSFNHMFADCFKLKAMDMTNWDTRSLQTVYNMFNDCRSVASLGDISHWDTSELIDAGCFLVRMPSLTGKLDLSGWTTPKIRNAANLIDTCTGLTEVDLSGMNTSTINSKSFPGFGTGIHYANDGEFNMNYMFKGSSNLKTIWVGPGWSTSQTTTTDMFKNCGVSEVTLKE